MDELNVTKLSYRRVQNLGNYETQALEVEVSVDEDSDPEEILDKMKSFVKHQLNK